MVKNPLDYGDDAARGGAVRLAQLGASLAAHDAESVHAMFTPACGQTPIGDAELPEVVSCVNAMGNVRALELGETDITDAGVSHLRRLKKLDTLDLHGTAITDQALQHIQAIPGLTELSLSGTKVTD